MRGGRRCADSSSGCSWSASGSEAAAGEEALQVIPPEIACFDEIEPCSYVSRDFAFLIQNATVGSYQITFDYCIEEIAIVASNDGSASFNINVVAS